MFPHGYFPGLYFPNEYFGSPVGDSGAGPDAGAIGMNDRLDLARAVIRADLANRILLDPVGSASITLLTNATGTTAGNTIGGASLVGITGAAAASNAAALLGTTAAIAALNTTCGALAARVLSLETRLNSQIET